MTSAAVLNPASVLNPSELAAARAIAADAPPFTPAQRDLLSSVFGPTVNALAGPQTTTP